MNSRLRKKNNKAYLLIELMVVVIILGLTICFIARAFNSSLLAVKKANIYSKAILFAEHVLWDMKVQQALGKPLARDDFPRDIKALENNINFECRQEAFDTEFPDLSEIVYTIFWQDYRTTGKFSFSAFMPTLAQK